ncbi:MAG TPA: glycosyltransferase family 2 protein [Solirubrobacteraceae bacterium]|nr:glycosyltransferase family 2 protein [Solirubrobacteraceae bacterium]
MSRPAVSVVVPFAGPPGAELAAVRLLASLHLGPEDERILADNSGRGLVAPAGIRVVVAAAERSPAHARNRGAALARGEWVLFLDADTVAPPDLVERFFTGPIDPDVGALTGNVTGLVARPTLAARFGAHANFLDAGLHLAHPYRPRAAAANLLVRRRAFLAVGGFCEGVAAAEDTDFSWRLQAAGWRLGFRPEATVGHHYRESLRELRRQWRAYAAGARWLEQRWPGYHPDPALAHLGRVLGARLRRSGAVSAPLRRHAADGRPPLRRSERVAFLAIQLLLAVEEQVGLRRSNDLPPR